MTGPIILKSYPQLVGRQALKIRAFATILQHFALGLPFQ